MADLLPLVVFRKQIIAATHVLRFKSTFTGPNPIDADAIFQKPLEVYASATHADRGVVEVSGSNLDKESLIEITRSSAASGNAVSAKIETKGMVENIPLKGVAAGFSVSQGEDEPSSYNLMQDRYSQVRHANS